MQRQTASADTIRSPVVHSTEPNRVAASASFVPQTDVSDTESDSQRSLEGGVTTDDSVSPIQRYLILIFTLLRWRQRTLCEARLTSASAN